MLDVEDLLASREAPLRKLAKKLADADGDSDKVFAALCSAHWHPAGGCGEFPSGGFAKLGSIYSSFPAERHTLRGISNPKTPSARTLRQHGPKSVNGTCLGRLLFGVPGKSKPNLENDPNVP